MLSLVIPCYNEEKNIPLIIERLHSAFQNRSDIEIILVNNGSTDNSAIILDQALQQLPLSSVSVVTVPVNKGYGYGILAGLDASTGEVMAWTHADMQTDPQDVLRAYDLYLAQNRPNPFVKGKRIHRPWLDAFFSYGMQLFANYILRSKLTDINAQPKLFSRDFYVSYVRDNAPSDFSLDLYVLHQAYVHQIPVINLPVIYGKRLHGEAKGGGSIKNKYKLSKRTIQYIWALKGSIKGV